MEPNEKEEAVLTRRISQFATLVVFSLRTKSMIGAGMMEFNQDQLETTLDLRVAYHSRSEYGCAQKSSHL